MRFLCLLLFLIPLWAYSQPIDRSEFPKADSIAEQYPRHPLNDLPGLSKKLAINLTTDEGKFRAIYKWVCLNIENDYNLAMANKRKRAKLTGDKLVAWNASLIPLVHKTLIDDYSTVCTGYAWLIEQLSIHAGLECEIVHGYGRTTQANIGGKGVPNHSWNAIRLNNNWYLCDATWSSGALDLDTRSFVREFKEAYFLSDPAFFVRNHYPSESKWTLLDQPPTLDDFLNAPLIYVAAYGSRIEPVSHDKFDVSASKGSAVTFQFARGENISEKKIQLMVRTRDTGKKPALTSDMFSISYVFASKGIFPVHLVMDGKPVYSYRVTVR
jgi:hypothetical protein